MNYLPNDNRFNIGCHLKKFKMAVPDKHPSLKTNETHKNVDIYL